MPQLLDLEDIGLGKHELPDDATPDEIKKITDDLVSRNRKSRMAALPATAAEEEGLDKGRVRSAGSSFMQGGVTGVAKPVSFFARMSDMLSAGQLLEASGRTVNPETSKALLQAGTEQANRTPEQRESQLAQDPVYKFGQDLEAGGKEAFPTNPKFKGEFFADVLPNAAGGMVPTIAAGAVNPVAAITQYGATSGQQGAEESIAAGDVKDANKVALAYFGLGALTEGMLGVPAYVMRYVRGAKAAGLDKKVVRETVAKMMAKSGAKEAGQESLEQVGQNVVAQQTFDPNRKLSEGVAENAAAGFILGAGVSGGAHGVGTAAANLEKRDRLEVLNELRSSPAWKQHIGNIGDNLQMRELASAASDRVANAIADRQPIKGSDARMAGARDRMSGFSYAYDEAGDVYNPVKKVGEDYNASINESLKERTLSEIDADQKSKFSKVASAIQSLFPGIKVSLAPENVDIQISPDGQTIEVSPTFLDDISKMYPSQESEALRLAVEEEQIHHGDIKTLGKDFKQRLSDVWTKAPKELRALVRAAYGETNIGADQWGAELMRMARQAYRSGRITESIHPRRGKAAQDAIEALKQWASENGITESPDVSVAVQPEPAPTTTIYNPELAPTEDVPVDQITLSKDVPNFKGGASEETGVVAENKLEGKYKRLGTAPIVVWRRKNGALEVITGRHRLDLARRNGEKTIRGQIVDEGAGFTKQQAMVFDAASNIRDGQGSVTDYADFFRNSPNLDEAEARQGGLLARAKGRSGWDVGKLAIDDVYALFKAGKISEAQATAIVRAAGTDASAQNLGARYALNKAEPSYIADIIGISKLQSAERGQSLDLFGQDDSAMQQMEQMATKAAEFRKEIQNDITSISGAVKRPESARKLGVDVKNPEAVKAKLTQLRGELNRWENWAQNADLVQKLRGEPAKPVSPAKPVESLKTGSPFTVDLWRGENGSPLAAGSEHRFWTDKESEALTYVQGDKSKLKKETITFKNPLVAENWMDAKRVLGLKASTTMAELLDDASRKGYDGVIWTANGSRDYIKLGKPVEASKVSDVDLARQTLEKEGKLSASLIQRRHKISYARAQAALDALASSGEITQPDKLSGWVRSEKKSPTATTPREPSQLERFQGIVKLAADSPNKLRASDVDRVMSEANKRPEELEAFRTWVLSKGISDDTIQEVANWKPEESPVEFPFKRPDLPKDVAPGENIFKTFSDRVKAWENQVAQWLKTQSDKKPVIWDEKPTVAGDKEYKGNVKSLTRNIGEKPWRVTTFYERDGKYMPAGHQEYNSREEAMNEEGKNVSKFYDKMPGAVMTEQEISGYQTMDSVPDKSKLVWYQLKGSASELQNKLRGTTIMQTFVRDSLNDGKIAFTESIDTANDPNRLEYLGLTPVDEAAKPAVPEPIFKEGDKVLVGEYPMTREGTIAASGPYKGGEHWYFVNTNLGREQPYREADIKLAEQPKKPVEVAKVKETSAVPATPQKYRLGKSPQTWTLVERITPTAKEKELGEIPVKVRNDKTGEVQVVLENELTPIKERTAEEKAAAKPKQTDDDKLRELGYTNISTLTTAEKKALIKRGPKGRNLAAPKDEGPAPSLFSEQEQVDFQMSAALRASELRAQANENERLANLRYEAHANGSQRAKGEYVAYKAEANRLRKQAMEFDRMAGNYVRTEPAKVSELKPGKPRQVDLFDRDLSNPKRASSLLFSNAANGLRVMFGQNEFNQNYRELRADSPADLMRVLNAPGLNISDDLRNVLRGMISSGTLKNFPGLSFAITEFIQGTIPGETTFTAEHLPDARLIRLLNLATGKDAAHELMHHLQYYLSAADRDYIRTERYRQIQAELAKPRSYNELATLERVLNEQVSSDEFLNNPDNARSLYHLANEYEYFAWMMQDRAADYFKGTFTSGFIARIKKAIKQFLFALKRVSGLTERHEEIWNEVISGKYEFNPEVRKAFNERIGRNNTKPTDAPFNSGDRLDPDTAWAQIDSASRLTIPKLVADKIADYRAAEAALEAKEYDTAQYKAAKDKISELLIAARRAAAQTGNDYWTSDEGMERLTASSEYLPDAIRELGIQFDPEALRELQKEIRFEGQSRNLASLRRRLRETEATLRMFQDLGFAPDDYAEFSKTAERLAKRIRRLESNNEVDNARGLTLEQRANEIQEINEQEIEFRAKRDALEIPLVNQVFVAPAENGIVPEARLSRTLKGFIAAMNDGSLSRHYKDAIAKLTWDHIRTFENVRAAYIRWMEARTKEVSNATRDANQKIATAKIDVGMLEILRDEIGRVGEGERGLTGTLDGREAVQFLNDSFGTVISFARNLRAAYPNGGAQAILTRLLSSFDGRTDSIAQLEADIRASTNEDLLSIRDKAGVADYALARIIYVLSRSGKMEDAVGALIRYGTRKMGEIPANNLDQIGTLLDSGDAIQIAEATDRINAMARQAEARQTFAAAELRAAQRELKQATIALKAAERGKELFDSVIGPDGRPSAEYAEIRSKVIEWLRLSEGMILANGGSDSRAGQTATVFKPFSVSAGDVAINQAQVTVDASTEAATKAEDFGRIQHWYDEAEKYVAAYEQADAAFESDPENNPHPEQLGFKGDVYNGLTEALKKKDSYLDPNVLFLEGRVENSPLQQFVMMKGYLGAYFRQMLAAGKNLVGMAGRDVMSKMIDYGNTLAISKKVYGDHRIAIIKARKAALDSHKKYAGNNLELYRTGIFNEMASEGRQFGVNVTEGMKLPVSGEVVTAEDLKLLRAIQEFYDDLRLNVTEKGGLGIIEKSGTEALGTMKVHIRKAASVGEQGLPMQVSREGDGYIKQIQLAYAKDKEAKVVPAAGDDFTEASKSNIVQFWNKNPRSLIRHILDAGRQFRTMSQDPMMLEAEKRAAQELRSENNPLAINTLDDAIALIAKNLPIDRGINVRRFAETNLLSELEQYHTEAKRQYGESTMLPMAEGIGGLSLRSEFTVPASQFHFPSNWYDYGGLTNHQLTMTTARAMHQRYLDLAMSLERAVAAIEGEIISAEKGGKPVNYKSLKEAVRVKQLTESVIGDLKSSWDVNNPSAIHSNINTVFDVFKSSLLGNITVNARNIIQGSQLYYNIAQSIEKYSRGLALLKALNHIAATVSRIPLDILFSQNSRLGRFNKRMLSGPLNKTMHALKLDFVERMVQNHIDRMTAVQELGYSQRDPWWDSLKAMWGDTNVQQSVRGEMLNKGALSKVSKVAGNVGRTAVLSYRMIGSEFTDKQINPTAISLALGIEKGLADVARFYGESRKSLGNYNPSDKRWLMQPDEFSSRISKSGKADNLAQLKSFLSGADITLEPLLWNYYQQYEAYKKGLRGEPTLFNDEQRSALRVAGLRAINAGDALNRPSTAAHNAFAKLLLTFQGYSSNYWVNWMTALKNARGTSKWSALGMAFPGMVMTALSMAIIGLLSDAVTGWYSQWAQGAAQRNVTLLDKEFWTDASKASDATTAATTAMAPLIGDAALFAQSLVVNNRGYEPTGRVLAFSLLNSAFQTMRGMFTLASSGDYANMWNPMRDFIIKHAGLGKEAAYNLSPHMGAVKDYSSGIGAYSFVAQQTGQKEDKAPGQVSSGKSYGPTTGIKEDISADFMRRDPSALMADFQKLVKYYASKGMDDPEAIARRDFQAMNPVVKAMSGKKPTEEQDAKIMASMSESQRNSVNKAVAGWNWGANVLGVDYSPVSEPRGSSGGAAAAFRPARRISFGGRSTGMRKISTGSRRIRIGKIGGGKVRKLRSRKIRLSSSGSRRLRSTRPRMRRIRLV